MTDPLTTTTTCCGHLPPFQNMFSSNQTPPQPPKQKIKITVRRDEPRRRAGKITITDALSGQEGRMRSLSAMRRQREKVKTQTESVPQVKQYRDLKRKFLRNLIKLEKFSH